jgi:hypothetical protein
MARDIRLYLLMLSGFLFLTMTINTASQRGGAKRDGHAETNPETLLNKL